jgi:hypothetical protein
LFVLKALDVLGVRPFSSGLLLNLHQAYFSGPPGRPGMKSALTPYNGLDQRGLNAIAMGRGADWPILAPFQPPVPPPINDGADKRQQKQQPK